MQMTSRMISAIVPSGPSTGSMMAFAISIGLSLVVLTTWTGSGGLCLGGNDLRLAGGFRHRRLIPGGFMPGISFFKSLKVFESFGERPAARQFERLKLLLDVLFVIRKLGGEIHELPGENPACGPRKSKDQKRDDQHGRHSAHPALDARNQRGEEKGQQRRQRDGNQNFACKIKPRDDECRQRDRP